MLRSIILLSLLLFFFLPAGAQLCTGSLGDPVVNITFGAGANPGPSLSTTNYNYLAADCPSDGQYAVRNNSNGCFSASWHSLPADHTGNPNGYFMLVNASFQPGDFFVETVKGLCGNTTYEFAAWIVNVLKTSACAGAGIKPNLTFSIETITGAKLATFNSGDIEATASPMWKQYGTFFTTSANVGDVVVRITNNAPGGCGNDLALDDITFRPCGAAITASIEGVNGNKMELCAGSSGTYRFTASISGGYNNPEVQWQESSNGGQSWSNIAGATANSFLFHTPDQGSFQYRVIVAEKGNINSPACRIASKPIEVVVHSLPEVSFNAPEGGACEDRSLLMEAKAAWDLNETATVQWFTPVSGGFTASEVQQGANRLLQLAKTNIRLQDSGMYTVRVTTAFGCSASASLKLLVYHKPDVDFMVSEAACAGNEVLLQSAATVENSSIQDYFWSWGENSFSNEKDVRPLFQAAGTYPVQLWVTSRNGCTSDTVQHDVVVHTNPVAAFQLPEVCLADAFAQFTNTSTIAGGGAMQYQWRFGDGAAGGGSTEVNPRYRYQAAGQYEVRLEVTSAAGCRADTMQLFTVNGSQPRALFSLQTTAVRCSADSIMLRNESTVDFGQITRVEIFWIENNNAAVTIDEVPEPGKEYRFDYSPFMTASAQNFTIRFVAYSGASCLSEAVQEITVHQSPQVIFEPLAALCQNEPPFLLSGGREASGMTGTGVYQGPGVDGQGIFRPAIAGAGAHAIVYRFTNTAGCADTAIQEQQVWPMPQVNAGPDQTLIAGGSVVLQATAQGEGLVYQWSPPEGLNNAQVLQPTAAPQSDRGYQLTATSAHGCVATDVVQVRVVPELYIPNAFTPNGDGINDTWQVPYLTSVAGAEVRVFNRYGQEVFYVKGSAQKWDGHFGGKAQPSGTYVYMVDLKNGRILKGTVLLLR